MAGHKTSECPEGGTLADLNAAMVDEIEMSPTTVAFASAADREAKYKETEARFGKCPICDSAHTY